jgi:phospholipase D1/2
MQGAEALRGHAWAPLAIAGIYMAGGLILFVHAVLLWATVLVFDPWHAFLYCEIGTLASGLTTYGLGRIARPEVVHKIAGSYLGKVSEALGRKGKRTLILLHWFPICPFSILNFLAGATHITFKDFLVGTFVGCTPGLLLIAFFGRTIRQILQQQHWLEIIPLVLCVLVLLIGGRLARRYLYHGKNS